ncbi:MAG: adenylosuccinate lyase [Proteobacteria bacterium]|nr:adenylosuccinate lyase [Pseudomonadota bacterium]
MINRYEIPAVSAIWNEESKFRRFLEVELALLKVWEESGRIPAGTVNAFSSAKIDPARIAVIENTTRHDVVAFCTSITEQVSSEHARFFHFGVTSSDIIDTALSLQIRESLLHVTKALEGLMTELDSKVRETGDLLCLGRSHGMAAEPMIFAQKFLSFRTEFARRLRDYRAALETEITGQLSGAVGNYSLVTPEFEARVLGKLGLKPEPVSSQVIPRDHIAKIVGIGALTGSAIERMAIELRHLHRSEVSEISEGFGRGQTGSSTMPHKKNPVASENVSGLARVLRSHEGIALENTLLWHERDISHSSAERLYLPDHFGLLVYALERMTKTLSNLEIHRNNIEEHVKGNHRIFSSLLLHTLIEQNTCTRETLYALVQSAAFQSHDLEGMIDAIRKSAARHSIRAELDGISFETLKAHYSRQFASVCERALREEG